MGDSGSAGSAGSAARALPASNLDGMTKEATSGFLDLMRRVQSEVDEVTAGITSARQAYTRYRNMANAERTKAFAFIGLQSSDKASLARTANEVFTDAQHLKRAKAAHGLVARVGGLEELRKLVAKADAIKNRKVHPEMLAYDDVLDGMSLMVGSIGTMQWDGGGKSFIRITNQFQGIKSSTTICFTLLVHCRSGAPFFMSLSRDTLARSFVLAKGDNVQQLFDEVCESSNIDALYKTHLASTPPRLQYLRHEFTRVVAQESRDGIKQCPGLSNIPLGCERASAAAAAAAPKRDGKRAASVADCASADDDEPVFLEERTREQRDKEGYENAIIL